MKEIDLIRQQYGLDYQNRSALQDEAALAQERLVAPQMKEQLSEAQAAVIAQTNPAKALKTIIEGLKGRMEDEYGNLVQFGEALMNQKGIAKISSMLIPFVNDPIRFGHITKQNVRHLGLQIANDITEDIGINWREYGIKNPTNKDIICDALIALIFITLTRSEEGGERHFLTKVVVESIGSNTNKKQNKGDDGWRRFFKL